MQIFQSDSFIKYNALNIMQYILNMKTRRTSKIPLISKAALVGRYRGHNEACAYISKNAALDVL